MKQLGDGTYGNVWKAVNRQTNEVVSCKQTTNCPRRPACGPREGTRRGAGRGRGAHAGAVGAAQAAPCLFSWQRL
jgi:hypothetical protein